MNPSRFNSATFSCAQGKRDYKLYLPEKANAPMALVVMLHGCTQDPDDFAAGTRMNELAEDCGFAVLYPLQPASANSHKCWNWFRAAHQKRGRGEPSILAEMTENIVVEQQLDPGRVFLAGLSAGAAMASILLREYPQLFAAGCLHSGLVAGAATSVIGALAAMKGFTPWQPSPNLSPMIPIIVFQGDQDKTVHPRNGERIIAQQIEGRKALGTVHRRQQASGGLSYTLTTYQSEGVRVAEHWLVHEAGHGWSGGSPSGTYTVPSGPDASREMLRFFRLREADRSGAG